MKTNIAKLNWWRRRTTLEKSLTVLSILACVTVIGLVSVWALLLMRNQAPNELKTTTQFNSALASLAISKNRNFVNNENVSCSQQKNVCLTEECVHTASKVLSKMKAEIEPCDDFYQFACGNFIDNIEKSKHEVAGDAFDIVFEKLQQQLIKIFAKERPEEKLKHVTLANNFYKACMNNNLIEDLGTKPMQQISESLGGWPVIVGNHWNTNNSWTWQDADRKFRKLGLSTESLVSIFIDVDWKNDTRYLLNIDQPSLGLDREYLIKGFNKTSVSAYYEFMVDVAVLFGAERETAEEELKKSLEFEIDLAKISSSNEKRYNISELYNLRSIKQLQKSWPYVQWLDYINAQLPKGLEVDESEMINVVAPSFFQSLDELLKRTNNRTLANYMMWRIHYFSIPYLTEELRQRESRFKTSLYGMQQSLGRGKECAAEVSSSLKIAVSSLYIREYFKQSSKIVASEMVENIREVFSQMLDEIEWMDAITKQEAKKKLNAMKTYIGYPNELLDNNKLQAYYSKLEIDPNRYFESRLNISIFNRDYRRSKFLLPVSKTDWTENSNSAEVNAFYNLLKNSIQIPAGILQDIFFNGKRPAYMNYGAIGFVIGHEITHGFDQGGGSIDMNGNLVDWWQPDAEKTFLEKVKCMVQQYGNYRDKETGLNLNGNYTQDENIADNGGIKESYLAYKKWVSKNGEEPGLPGLNYTPQQMFWISYAQTWCAKLERKTIENIIETLSHSPNEFRVLGPLRNMKEFSRDFHCPENSPMNPVHKCQIW